MKRVTEETVQWLRREMTSPEGGFYSSLDADTEGEEGKFYVWTERELEALLGTDAPAFKMYYGTTGGGNFEGSNILYVRAHAGSLAAREGVTPEAFERMIFESKAKLYLERARRARPARDEKILAGWNGLMLRGLATAARAFENEEMSRLAVRNAEFLYREMLRNGRVMRSHKEGVTRINGFLEDQAAVALGFIAVYEMTFEPEWIRRATEIAHKMIELFWDDKVGAFFDTAKDSETLIGRPRDVTDNAIPSGNSLAIDLLVTLAELTQDSEMRRRANFVIESLATPLLRYPSAFGHLLGVTDMLTNGAVEVAIAGNRDDKSFRTLEHEVSIRYVPSLVLAGGSESTSIALLNGREARNGKATAYVCRSYACEEPVSDPATFAEQLEKAGRISTPVI